MIFIDTSAFLAVLDGAERRHSEARAIWERIQAALATTSYVLVDATALAQHRLGMEAARVLQMDMVPVLSIQWVDEDPHRTAQPLARCSPPIGAG